LAFYWIFSGFLQIIQLLFFHFYNESKKKNEWKRKKNIIYQINS
jgi:hypothetical protein